MEVRDRIIVALDALTLEKAIPLVEALHPLVGCFKVGLELLTAVGAPRVIECVHSLGGSVFYDGKFDDIPNTIGGAARAVAAKRVKMFNVHVSAGLEAIKAAVANKGKALVLGVSALTFLDETECLSIFGSSPPSARVLFFADILVRAGADGIICSPQELEFLKPPEGHFNGLLKVTQGVRPQWANVNDQKRVMTPAEAIKAGATHLVIGRSITNPPPEIGTPIEAVRRIAEEIASVL